MKAKGLAGITAAVVVTAVCASSAWAAPSVIYACVDKDTGIPRTNEENSDPSPLTSSSGVIRNHEYATKLFWNVTGPQGPGRSGRWSHGAKGEKGATGATGAPVLQALQGVKGATGAAGRRVTRARPAPGAAGQGRQA